MLANVLFGATGYLFICMLDREEIHYAAATGDVARVERILDRHPDRLEARNRLQLTPLHRAAWEGRAGVLTVLIRRGANVDARWDLAKTGDGRWNALHITAIQGHVEAARVLIQAGADVNLKSLAGETPLDVAVRNRHAELAAVFRGAGGRSAKDP